MAKIVLGVAAPHSGLLGKPPDTWLEDGERDKRNPELWFRGRRWTYRDLERARAGENLKRFLGVEERRKRHGAGRAAIEVLRKVCRETPFDLLIVLGKDQKEIFIDATPTFALQTSAAIENGPPQRSLYTPGHDVAYPGAPQFAEHLLHSLQGDGFDIATVSRTMPNKWLGDKPITPHAYGFVYHDLLDDKPPPSVPVYINTFYPPNQPSIGRCIAFGEALTRAIESWDASARVAIIASGGFSHFVCDEELDARFLDAFKKSDIEALRAVDESLYQSGTSEVKLFVPILTAMRESACPTTLVDYVPCYRTEAGTGEGMAFMYWLPDGN